MENFENRDRSAKKEDPKGKKDQNLPGQGESERDKSEQRGRPGQENPGEGVTSHYGPSREAAERSQDEPSGKETGDAGDEGVGDEGVE
jgi:hypothetical protein